MLIAAAIGAVCVVQNDPLVRFSHSKIRCDLVRFGAIYRDGPGAGRSQGTITRLAGNGGDRKDSKAKTPFERRDGDSESTEVRYFSHGASLWLATEEFFLVGATIY